MNDEEILRKLVSGALVIDHELQSTEETEFIVPTFIRSHEAGEDLAVTFN